MSWAVSLADGSLGRAMKWGILENWSTTENDGVTGGWREASDKVHGDHGIHGNRERTEEPSWRGLGRDILGAGRTSRHEVPDVLSNRRSPRILL